MSLEYRYSHIKSLKMDNYLLILGALIGGTISRADRYGGPVAHALAQLGSNFSRITNRLSPLD